MKSVDEICAGLKRSAAFAGVHSAGKGDTADCSAAYPEKHRG